MNPHGRDLRIHIARRDVWIYKDVIYQSAPLAGRKFLHSKENDNDTSCDGQLLACPRA